MYIASLYLSVPYYLGTCFAYLTYLTLGTSSVAKRSKAKYIETYNLSKLYL